MSILKLNEIFTTIQGEGPYIGRRATFVRLAGCNLCCSDCDSRYSWDEGEEKNCYDVLAELKEHAFHPGFLDAHIYRNYVVVTGGEPLLQADEVGKMILAAPNTWFWGIETNGTIFNPTEVLDIRDIHFIISPKLSSMHPDGLKKFDEKWIELLRNTIDKVFFKFVVSTEADIGEMINFMIEHRIPKDKVWIMPKCTTATKHFNKWTWIFDKAVELGINASPRLHVMAHGNKRGV